MRKITLIAALLGSFAITPAAVAQDAQRTVSGPQGQTATRNRTIPRTAPGEWSSKGTATGRRGNTATRSGSAQRGQ